HHARHRAGHPQGGEARPRRDGAHWISSAFDAVSLGVSAAAAAAGGAVLVVVVDGAGAAAVPARLMGLPSRSRCCPLVTSSSPARRPDFTSMSAPCRWPTT